MDRYIGSINCKENFHRLKEYNGFFFYLKFYVLEYK